MAAACEQTAHFFAGVERRCFAVALQLGYHLALHRIHFFQRKCRTAQQVEEYRKYLMYVAPQSCQRHHGMMVRWHGHYRSAVVVESFGNLLAAVVVAALLEHASVQYGYHWHKLHAAAWAYYIDAHQFIVLAVQAAAQYAVGEQPVGWCRQAARGEIAGGRSFAAVG